MYRAYKFRIYPTDEQRILINKTFGCYRYVYNYFLSKCKENGIKSAYDMCKKLSELYADLPWLKEVDSCSLICAIFNLEDAYKNFFAKRSDYPKFKCKGTRASYRTNCIRRTYKNKEYTNIILDLKNKKIKLPKLGEVNIREYRNLSVINGKIINATVLRESTEKYYVSVVVDEVRVVKKKVMPKSIVGIDLGIKDLVITSNGEKFDNHKEIKKYEKRIKRLQKKLARQDKESNNYQKTRIRLARVYSKMKNARKHYRINIVNKLVNENDIIVSEKLDVKKMSKNHNLAPAILDASFSKICTLLKWKVEQKGKYYYQVDTYFPSSKTCSVCGNITEKTNDLIVRNWECEKCGTTHDRDFNASINIMFEGLKFAYLK